MDERKLERYLGELERELGGFSVGERAEILTAMRDRARRARAAAPSTSMDAILEALGAPRAVAARLRADRGLPPASPPVRRQALRTVALALAAMFGVTVAALGALAWRAWPLLTGGATAVPVLGGALDARADEFEFDDTAAGVHRVLGRVVPKAGTVDRVRIEFTHGKVELQASPSDEIRWQCRVRGVSAIEPKVVDRAWTLELTPASGVDCDVAVPARYALSVRGANGNVDVERPGAAVDVALANGKIAFEPDPSRRYRFDTSVRNGSQDRFASASGPGVIPVKLAVTNGRIERD
jgi:hypothetical protein